MEAFSEAVKSFLEQKESGLEATHSLDPIFQPLVGLYMPLSRCWGSVLCISHLIHTVVVSNLVVNQTSEI